MGAVPAWSGDKVKELCRRVHVVFHRFNADYCNANRRMIAAEVDAFDSEANFIDFSTDYGCLCHALNTAVGKPLKTVVGDIHAIATTFKLSFFMLLVCLCVPSAHVLVRAVLAYSCSCWLILQC